MRTITADSGGGELGEEPGEAEFVLRDAVPVTQD